MPFAARIKSIRKRWGSGLRLGLAGKITLWYMVLLILTVLMLSGLTFWGNRQALYQDKRQVLENTVSHILSTINEIGEGQAMSITDPDVLSGYVPKGVTVQLSSPTGKILQHFGQFPYELPLEQQSAPITRVFHGQDFYFVAKPIQSGGQTIGYLQAVIDLEEIEFAQKVLLGQMAWIGGSALLLAAIGGLFLSRQALAPLENLNQEISNLTAHDLDRRIPVRGKNDELDRLAQSFNQMLERLEESFQKQQQFVANASHELRTPLMVIGGHSDILKRWGAEDSSLVRDSAVSISVEIEMMTKLVENLLTLAREQIKLNLTNVDLEELILDSTAGLPYLQKYTTEFDLESGVRIQADELYLRQLLRIILENASKYVPEGGKINFILRKVSADAGEKALIRVIDNGPGIPLGALNKIFDRFYRVDVARSRNVPGHGLGLSIAQKIVEAHLGRIWAENTEPHGAIFNIEFPIGP